MQIFPHLFYDEFFHTIVCELTIRGTAVIQCMFVTLGPQSRRLIKLVTTRIFELTLRLCDRLRRSVKCYIKSLVHRKNCLQYMIVITEVLCVIRNRIFRYVKGLRDRKLCCVKICNNDGVLRDHIGTFHAAVRTRGQRQGVDVSGILRMYFQRIQYYLFSKMRSETPGWSDLSCEIKELLDNVKAFRLTKLEINHSVLKVFPPFLCDLSNLEILDLSYNIIEQLPSYCFKGSNRLQILHVDNNMIRTLQDGVFDGLTNLTNLYLNDNKLTSVGSGVFSNLSNHPHLYYIYLQNNLISEIDSWPIMRILNAEDIGFVGLQDNPLRSITTSRQWHFKCSTTNGLKAINLINTNINHLSTLFKALNFTLANLLCLGNYSSSNILSPLFRLDLRNDLVCDCLDFDYYRMYSTVTGITWSKANGVSKYAVCKSPPELAGRCPFDIPLDRFVCNTVERCSQGCQCVYQPATAKLSIMCTKSTMHTLPTELPVLPKSYTKYSVHITGNLQLRKLDFRDYMHRTGDFEFTNSLLSEISDIEVWRLLLNVDSLRLHGNRLQSIPDVVRTLNVTANVSLERNPWSCSCDNQWMNDWLRSIRTRLSSVDDILCDTPTRLRGNNLLMISPDEFCSDPLSVAVRKALTASLTTVGGVIVAALAIVLTIYRFRFLLFVRWKFHPFDRDECEGEDMEYDVFLSACSEDERDHVNRIIDSLESLGYSVCYHTRDFNAGETIENNMRRAVERSKRTVCVVTDNFIRRFVLDGVMFPLL